MSPIFRKKQLSLEDLKDLSQKTKKRDLSQDTGFGNLSPSMCLLVCWGFGLREIPVQPRGRKWKLPGKLNGQILLEDPQGDRCCRQISLTGWLRALSSPLEPQETEWHLNLSFWTLAPVVCFCLLAKVRASRALGVTRSACSGSMWHRNTCMLLDMSCLTSW